MTLRSRHPPTLKLRTRQETLPLSSRAKSPGDHFAVSKKLAGLILRSVGSEPDPPRPRLRRDRRSRRWCYQGITFRSLKNLLVIECGASDASHTTPEAPSAIERVALEPPMSVRTQPGQTELTANFGKAAASCAVTPFNAVFEMQ